MYTNSKYKPKEPEINTLRCGSMATWNTGQRLSQPAPTHYIETLTKEYIEIQHQNYLTYHKELMRTTNPLGLGLEMQNTSMISRIDSLPPGRPRAKEQVSEKPKAMTYYEHRRMKEMAENPEGYANSSFAMGATPQPAQYQQQSRSSVQRNNDNGWSDKGRHSNGKRPNEAASSGWSDEEKPASKHVKTESNEEWDDLLPPQSKAVSKKNGGGDSWDSAPAKLNEKSALDGDDWDSLLPVSTKKSASSEVQPVSSTSVNPPAAKNDDDWDDLPVPTAKKPQSQQKDDWSDDEKQASSSYRQDSSSYRPSDSGGSRGRGSYSGNSYRGNSRPRESSSFPRSREGSSDRYRSASRTSNRSDGSGSSNQTPYVRQPRPGSFDVGQRPPRQPRPDDWNCTGCKGVNFGHRTDCFRCHEPKGENPTNDAGPSVTSYQRPPREPRPDDWNCASCKGVNFGRRTDCYRCHEPKDENSSSGNSFSSSYQSNGSYRGSARGGFGASRRGGNNGFGGNRSYDSKPAVSSGWSDGEDETPKKASVVLSGGDDWDAEKSPVKVAPKVQSGDDDDWDAISVPIKVSSLPAASNSKKDDDWNSFATPTKIEPSKVAPKLKSNDGDEWDVPDAPVPKQQAVKLPKHKPSEEDEWDSFKAPAKIPKISVDAESFKGEETLDEPSSSTIDDDVVVKMSDVNDDDSWERSDRSVAAECRATDTTESAVAEEVDSWLSPNEMFDKKVVEPKANSDDDW